MKLAVPRQGEGGETRVGLTPAVVKKLADGGLTVLVQAGAGHSAGIEDAAYTASGATVVSDDSLWSEADLIVAVQPPGPEQAARIKSGAVLVGMLAPLANVDLIVSLNRLNVTVFSMEFVPRISRAQAMDVLSSQANIAGYKAVLLAADHCPKLFPMMMTAAGTIAPSRVFIIGAGVAGLQAIATARRLGAVVEAYDVRPAVKEQVQSLGARFVELPMTRSDAQTQGGYAKEQTEQERQQQIDLMAKHIAGADAVIATAAVFGKAPPLLIPKAMVERMARGSVIVDLAADARAGRGNCEITRPGQTYTTDAGVTVVGLTNLSALVPVHASQMYANNMLAFLREITADKQLKLNLDDEIQKGALICHGGQITNALVQAALRPAV
jgi:NAD(P) transhydrogenase subunit alpha